MEKKMKNAKGKNLKSNEIRGKDLEYRHLSSKDKIKLLRRKRRFKFLAKITFLVSSISLILVIFGIGFAAFYILTDSQKVATEGSGFSEIKKDVFDYSEEGDKELENSLKKNPQDRQAVENNESKDEPKDINKNNTDTETEDFSQWNEQCPAELIVVNGKNRLSDKYKVDVKLCRGKEIGALAWESLEKMIQAAAKDKIVLWISSGYRSVKYQQNLFDNQVNRELNKGISLKEAEALAQTVVARPGMSEHNTGLAADFNGVQDDFYKTKEYKWLMDNAAKFGFIERYQEKWKKKTGVIYEPWHFRFVGSYAQSIKDSNLCLEDWVLNNKDVILNSVN